MKHKWAVTILLAACLVIAGAKKEKDKEKGDDKARAGDSTKTETVTIKGLQYDPAQVTVRKGDAVVWINRDDHDHTVHSDDGSFDSGNIGNGQRFRKTFEKAGTFSYSCKYHPRMKGSVIVK